MSATQVQNYDIIVHVTKFKKENEIKEWSETSLIKKKFIIYGRLKIDCLLYSIIVVLLEYNM